MNNKDNLLDYYYQKGLIPRRYYYQLKGLSPQEAFKQQRQEIINSIKSQKEQEEIAAAIEKTIEDLLEGFK